MPKSTCGRTPAMTFREMNRAVFAGEHIPHVFFQPRFEPWYDWQLRAGLMPEAYRELGMIGTYDTLGCSIRYVHYYTGMPDPIVRHFSPPVRVSVHEHGHRRSVVYETPAGELVEEQQFTTDETWRTVGFPVKDADDLRVLRSLYGHTSYSFSAERFKQGSDFIAGRGEPQFWVPKSPYQALAQWWMRLEDLIYALADCPTEVEQTMRAIDDSYDGLYEELAGSSIIHIINFGENIHDQLFSPRYFERYLIPWYEKRAGQMRSGGIYTDMHLDGNFGALLKYLAHLPFDGLEALTPEPQGDVSIEQMREHLGDKILLDGIPAILFLPHYSMDQFTECVERLVELFHPRLVLGVSDEVPQGAEATEAIDRIRMVSEWCKGHGTR